MQQRTRQRLLERGATAEFPLQHRIDPVGGGTKLPQRMFDMLAVGAGPNVLSFGRFQNADEIAAALA